MALLLLALASGSAQEEDANSTTLELSLPAWDSAVLPCPALAPLAERGLHEGGQVLSVWVSPVGQMVLPATHQIDENSYDNCADTRTVTITYASVEALF